MRTLSTSKINAEILFVDDDAKILTSIKRMLHDYSDFWHCHFASRAAEAIEIIEKQHIDLVTADLNMPGQSGFDLLEKFKDNERFSGLPFLILTGDLEHSLKRKVLDLGATDLLVKPVTREDLVARIDNLLHIKFLQDKVKQQKKNLELKVRERTRGLESSRLDLIWRLAKTAELRDAETGNHLVRVAHYSRILATNMDLDGDICERIFQTVLLHDIGKISIPDYILLKPDKLNAQEWKIMQSHCQQGADLLKPDFFPPSLLPDHQVSTEMGLREREYNPFLLMAAEIALCHHEHWDGSGYPAGLSGEAIPLPARICTVADVFDALSTPRAYNVAFSEAEVLSIMRESRGNHFDPEISSCFEKCLSEFRMIRQGFADQKVNPRKGFFYKPM